MTAQEKRSELWRTAYKTIIVIAILVTAYLLYQLGEIIVVLFGAIIFASSIRPLVDRLVRWGLHRGLSILAVQLLILLGLSGLIIIAIPPLINLFTELFSTGLIFVHLRRFLGQLTAFGWDQLSDNLPTAVTLPDQMRRLIDLANDTAEQQAWPMAQGTVIAIGKFVLVFVMCFYWLMSREQLLDLLLKLSPLSKQHRVNVIWNDIEETLGAYIRGQVGLMLTMGFSSYVGLALLGIPFAPALGVVAGIMEAVPYVGPFIGAIPAILVGLTVSPTAGILVALWYLTIQQIESYILIPKVMEKSVGLNPLVIIIALIAGGMLNGVIGAVLAIPVAGALQVIARHLLIQPTIDRQASRRAEGGAIIFEEDEDDKTSSTELVLQK
ncbi:MAG: AI-2E family transporter [Anaerolineae bacterium]|nr:AI-2E family transporter [Anaerolineae bacterium]